MALDLIDRLEGAHDRTYLEISGSTHMILTEPARMTAFAQIIAYLRTAFAAKAGRS